jgi:hypothetical protein
VDPSIKKTVVCPLLLLLQIGVIDNQKLERGAAVQWIHQLKKPWSVPYY